MTHCCVDRYFQKNPWGVLGIALRILRPAFTHAGLTQIWKAAHQTHH